MLRITGHFRTVAPERIGTSMPPDSEPEEITIEEAAAIMLEAAVDLPGLLKQLSWIAENPHKDAERYATNAEIRHWGPRSEWSGCTQIYFREKPGVDFACVIISEDGSNVDAFLAAIATSLI